MSEDLLHFERPAAKPEINDGGPAFPRPQAETSIGGNMEQEGMSLRDYFAGQVLGEVFRMVMGLPSSEDRPPPSKWAALVAYEVADAMLAARKGGAA